MNLFDLLFFWREVPVPPSEFEYEHGGRYCFHVDRNADSAGVIVDGRTDEICWRYAPDPLGNPHNPLNYLNKPALVVFDRDEKEVFRVRRQTRIPPAFSMFEGGQNIGLITLRSVFRNRYTIDLKDGASWDFRMPLFTLHFWGKSELNQRVWVLVGPSKRQWNVLTQPDGQFEQLLFVLAFIHREWWFFG